MSGARGVCSVLLVPRRSSGRALSFRFADTQWDSWHDSARPQILHTLLPFVCRQAAALPAQTRQDCKAAGAAGD